MRSVYDGTPGSERYAGLWMRVGANVLDGLILAALHQILLLAPAGHDPDVARPIGSTSAGLASVVGQAFVALALPACVIVGSWVAFGASPGKLLLGLRIVDEPTGGRAGVGQCIGRYVMALISVACVGLGYLYVAIDPRKQGWHDKIVRTLVVRRGA